MQFSFDAGPLEDEKGGSQYRSFEVGGFSWWTSLGRKGDEVKVRSFVISLCF